MMGTHGSRRESHNFPPDENSVAASSFDAESVVYTENPHIDALTGIRGWAAVWVLVYHAWVLAGPRRMLIQIGETDLDFTPLFSCGWAGAQMFFVLSGFLLALPFAEWQAGQRSKPKLRRYLARRVRRVFPAYYFQLAILVTAFYVMTDQLIVDSWASAFRHLFMLFVPLPMTGDAINGVWWTLPIEFSFYLVLPVLAMLLKLKRGFVLAIVCISTMVIWRYAIVTSFPDMPMGRRLNVALQLPGSLDSFGAGLIGALIYVNRNSLSSRWYDQITATLAGPLIGVAVVSACMYWVHWQFMDYGKSTVIFYAWTLIFSLGILLFILSGMTKNTTIRLLCANRVIVFIGTISYGLYLWHLPIMDALKRFSFFTSSTEYLFPELLVAAMTISILMATISYHFVERPLSVKR